MTNLIEVKTGDLVGEPLAWAVAKAEGQDIHLEPPQYGNPWRVFVRRVGEATTRIERYNPWESWVLGGPLIEKYDPEELRAPGRKRYAEVWIRLGEDARVGMGRGDTRLIAACRAIVSAKLGKFVQVPKELMP